MDSVLIEMLNMQMEPCVSADMWLYTFWILVLVCDVVSFIWAHSFGADVSSNRFSWSTEPDKFSICQLHQFHNICIDLTPHTTWDDMN